MMGHIFFKAGVLLAMLPLMHSCDQSGETTEPAERGAPQTAAGAAFEPDELQGLKLYLGYCFVCHGQKGDGRGPYAAKLSAPPADFTDSTYFKGMSDDELYDFISKGGLAHGKSMHMKPFGFQMTPEQIRSAVAYIRVLNRHDRIDVTQSSGYSGEEIYSNSCVMCHGETGAGDGRVAKMLNLDIRPLSPETIDSYSSAKLFNVVEDGFPNDTAGVKSYMPAWGGTLTEQEIIDVIAYIRTLGK